jgi:hypothetical protein
MKVVKRLPLYKSNAVSDNNDHKLYWIDIVLHDDGNYSVNSYAQLFTRSGNNIIPGSVRRYVIHVGKFLGECIRKAESQLKRKQLRRGYMKFSDREEINVTASPETIIQFLLKYA